MFSLVTFQHWTRHFGYLPGTFLANTQGCYPRGNACPSGSVQRFPDRWEVGHVTWSYDEKYLEVSTHFWLSVIGFWKGWFGGKILECSRDKFRMVMEVLNSRVGKTQGFCQEDQDIFTHFATNSGLGDRHATNKWLFGHFMNGKIGLPRWTRLPWWSYRSYPPGSILSFCLAVRCWLEDVTIPLLGGISAAPQSVVVSKVVVAMNMIGLFPMTPLVFWDGRMDTLYWKILFIQHHCRICSR